MAKFKSEQLIDREVPFILGSVKGDLDGFFEVADEEAEFVKFLTEETDFERLDAPKQAAPVAAPKAPAQAPVADAEEDK
jgi:hypothetical protein